MRGADAASEARKGCSVWVANSIMARLVHYIHNVARFFEVLNGGALHPDYDLTLKPASGYMLRAYSTRTMEKRGAITREEVAFHTSFPDISNSEIFVPQRETGTEYNDISRETTITPAQCKAKVAAGEWFIYAEPKVACDANGIYGLRSRDPLQINPQPAALQRSFKPLARPLQSPRTPLHALSENPPIWVFPKIEFHDTLFGALRICFCAAPVLCKKKARKTRAANFRTIRRCYFLISLWSVLRLREGLYFIFSTFSCVLRKLRDVI